MSSNRNYGLVKNEEHLTKFVDKLLSEQKVFSFDVETGYTGPLRAKAALQHYSPDYVLAGLSFTNNPDWARYIPIGHDAPAENLDSQHVARELWRLLRSGMGVPHNGLMELSSLSVFFRKHLWDDDSMIPGTGDFGEAGSDDPNQGWGVSFSSEVRAADGLFPLYSDTMIESMLVGENKKKGLKELSEDILGVKQTPLIELFTSRGLKGQNAAGKMVKYNTTNLRFNVLPLDPDVVAYGCEDSALTLEHHYRNYELVKDQLIFRTELRLTPILVRMEKEGLLLDWAEYERRAIEVEKFRDAYAEHVLDRFSEVAGELININLNSAPQVRTVLFEKMGIKPTIMTDGGAAGVPVPSTGEKAMRTLTSKHPEIKSLLQYREIAKLLASYIKKYLNELRYDPSGRAHPSHKQEGAGTGRFSVDGVSYQQWPKPYHYELPSGASLDLNYRNFLTSPEGWRIIGFDYANVELRIVAGLAQERAMLEAFANGVDIHKQTASLMLKIPLDEVTDKQRSVGKTLNFAIVYGSGADNIATLITSATGELCTVEQAQAYLDQYFEAFPDLKAWMDARILEGREAHAKFYPGAAAHWVTTAFGRRIPIFEYESEFRSVRNKGDRNAVNGPVQGAAADYMKIGMVRADAAIKRAEADGRFPEGAVRLIMTIHDALEFYVREDVDTKKVIEVLEPAISFPVDAHIPNAPVIRADWHEGYRWGEVADIEQDADGNVLYSRKLELPDKTKHSFVDDSLKGLVAQIDKFWEERGASALDAKILEELDFDYDPDEDEFYVPDNTNLGFPVDKTSPEQEAVIAQALEANHGAQPKITESEPESPIVEEEPAPVITEDEPMPVVDEEPEWLHNPTLDRPQLRLTLAAMPTNKSWPAFQEYVKARPGSATLVVAMPKGEVTIENVNLVPENEAELRLIFGEAVLRLDEPVSINERVLEGISL